MISQIQMSPKSTLGAALRLDQRRQEVRLNAGAAPVTEQKRIHKSEEHAKLRGSFNEGAKSQSVPARNRPIHFLARVLSGLKKVWERRLPACSERSAQPPRSSEQVPESGGTGTCGLVVEANGHRRGMAWPLELSGSVTGAPGLDTADLCFDPYKASIDSIQFIIDARGELHEFFSAGERLVFYCRIKDGRRSVWHSRFNHNTGLLEWELGSAVEDSMPPPLVQYVDADGNRHCKTEDGISFLIKPNGRPQMKPY